MTAVLGTRLQPLPVAPGHSDDALLILVSQPQCDMNCELVAATHRLTEQYAGLGLRGLWVTTAQPTRRTATPLAGIVVPDCAGFLGARRSDFLVLGRNGVVTDGGLALRSLDLAALVPSLPAQTLVAISDSAWPQGVLEQRLSNGNGSPVVRVGSAPAWIEDESIGGGAIPVPLLKQVVTWMSQ